MTEINVPGVYIITKKDKTGNEEILDYCRTPWGAKKAVSDYAMKEIARLNKDSGIQPSEPQTLVVGNENALPSERPLYAALHTVKQGTSLNNSYDGARIVYLTRGWIYNGEDEVVRYNFRLIKHFRNNRREAEPKATPESTSFSQEDRNPEIQIPGNENAFENELALAAKRMQERRLSDESSSRTGHVEYEKSQFKEELDRMAKRLCK